SSSAPARRMDGVARGAGSVRPAGLGSRVRVVSLGLLVLGVLCVLVVFAILVVGGAGHMRVGVDERLGEVTEHVGRVVEANDLVRAGDVLPAGAALGD